MKQAGLTFGFGARACIGQNMSTFLLSKAVSQLLCNYEFKFPSCDHAWKVHGGWLVPQDNFKVLVAKRSPAKAA